VNKNKLNFWFDVVLFLFFSRDDRFALWHGTSGGL